MASRSILEMARAAYRPQLSTVFESGPGVSFRSGSATKALADHDEIAERFPRCYGRPLLQVDAGGPKEARPKTVGVVLSGGQAPGGHNVIAGLFDGIGAMHEGSRLVGFCGGPHGIVERRFRELDAHEIERYRNTGGFDMIGSGRDKIETADQIEASLATCDALGLDGLVIVGGDDSNTNAAVLAEAFLEAGSRTTVVGVPKTIDGDLKGEQIEASFGFDTATRIYSGLIGNICRDARSAGKYWHFVKLMGRSASHVTLECALQTQPNVALIAEEIEARALTLDQVVEQVADVVRRRAELGLRHGVCLIPEGLIEFVPEMRRLIDELNRALAESPEPGQSEGAVTARLGAASRSVFDALPAGIRGQLLIDRDSHGNVQVSKIDTERLLIAKVRERVEGKFDVQGHFFGYEGRSAAPSDFDADYTTALGRVAASLTAAGHTGYMCGIGNLIDVPTRWTATAVPLTSMMRMETRKGKRVPVIGKALVRTDGAVFRAFAERREEWQSADRYIYPGGVQYFGPARVTRLPSRTLLLERTGSDDPPDWVRGGAS